MIKKFPYPWIGGMDRSLASLHSKGFYDLYNIRPARREPGRLEQTPRWTLTQTLAQGTYYDAGSQTEPSSSSVVFGAPGTIYMTEYVIHNGATQRQVFYQTTVPAAVTLYTHLRLDVVNRNALGINLGSTLDVEMTGAAAFRWRKNGGGWTAGVPSTAGVSIDGGNAILYFLANTGYAGTEAWAWTRTDCSWQNSVTAVLHRRPFVSHKGKIYFFNLNWQLMVYDVTADYVKSAGYRPIYGQRIAVFYDHLVIGRYGTTQAGINSQAIIWSDLNDLEQFFATDTNEADAYTVPVDSAHGPDFIRVENVFTINKQLHILTSSAIYASPYIGLPVVFSFDKVSDFGALDSNNGLDLMSISGSDTEFIRSADIMVAFDGVSVRDISRPVSRLVGSSALLYNEYHDELLLQTSSSGLLTMQNRVGLWHRRYPPTDGTTYLLYADSVGRVLYGGSSRRIFIEDTTFAAQPIYDAAGSTYGTPLITFHLFSADDMSIVKETSRTYLTAKTGTTGSSTYYSLLTDTKVDLYYRVCDNGEFTGSATSGNATWDSGLADGGLSDPRLPFRAISFELQLRGAVNGKPPGPISIYGFAPEIYLPGDEDER